MIALVDSQCSGQCTNWKAGLLLVKFILMAWTGEGLLMRLIQEMATSVVDGLERSGDGFGLRAFRGVGRGWKNG